MSTCPDQSQPPLSMPSFHQRPFSSPMISSDTTGTFSWSSPVLPLISSLTPSSRVVLMPNPGLYSFGHSLLASAPKPTLETSLPHSSALNSASSLQAPLNAHMMPAASLLLHVPPVTHAYAEVSTPAAIRANPSKPTSSLSVSAMSLAKLKRDQDADAWKSSSLLNELALTPAQVKALVSALAVYVALARDLNAAMVQDGLLRKVTEKTNEQRLRNVDRPPVTLKDAIKRLRSQSVKEAVCVMCISGKSSRDDPIVFCNSCYVAVHLKCVGERQNLGKLSSWRCRKCYSDDAASTRIKTALKQSERCARSSFAKSAIAAVESSDDLFAIDEVLHAKLKQWANDDTTDAETKSRLAVIQKKQVMEAAEKDDCAICLLEKEDGFLSYKFDCCNAIVHLHCADKMLRTRASRCNHRCPSCFNDIPYIWEQEIQELVLAEKAKQKQEKKKQHDLPITLLSSFGTFGTIGEDMSEEMDPGAANAVLDTKKDNSTSSNHNKDGDNYDGDVSADRSNVIVREKDTYDALNCEANFINSPPSSSVITVKQEQSSFHDVSMPVSTASKVTNFSDCEIGETGRLDKTRNESSVVSKKKVKAGRPKGSVHVAPVWETAMLPNAYPVSEKSQINRIDRLLVVDSRTARANKRAKLR